jgi:hypothetical protein
MVRRRGHRFAAGRIRPSRSIARQGLAACAVVAWLCGTAAAAEDCATEADALARSEAELPRVDLTPPIHRQLVCITLETLVEFAQRIGHHVGRCPASSYAAKAPAWAQAGNGYAAQFRRYHCRRTL